MDISRLAARQKRAADWEKVLKSGLPDREIEGMFRSALGWYRETLARVWAVGDASPQDVTLLYDLERRLDELHEEARFYTNFRPKSGIGAGIGPATDTR